MTRPFHALPTLLALMMTAALFGCSDPSGDEQRTRLAGHVFGTFYEVTIAAAPEELDTDALKEGITEALDIVDQQMSTYREDSDLNRLNQAGTGEWVSLPEETVYVLTHSETVARETDGAFDVTVGGLVNLWTFGPEGRPREAPTEDEIEQRLATVGYQQLEIDAENLRARRHNEFFVDLSGVAKGYAVDRVAAYLRDQGFDNFLVNIGGDMIASGQRARDQSWRIGVEVPEDGRQQMAHLVLPLDDISLATSGDYRNYFEEDGQRYSHTIDPRTGKPVEHRLASVSVFHPSNTLADAYATGLMVMGEDRALEFARERDLAVILIDRHQGEFRTRVSPALEALFEPRWLEEILDH